MAKRFGGKYSPAGTAEDRPKVAPTASYARASVDPVGARSNAMFVPPVFLVSTTLTAGAIQMGLGLAGAACLALGTWLLREGLRAEAAFNARRIARRPAIPRKIFAAVLAGLGAACAVVAHDPTISLLSPAIFGIIAIVLHLVAFGVDPLSSKSVDGVDTFQQDRVARAVDEAEAYLSEIRTAVRAAGDRSTEQQMETFVAKARDLIRSVEEDPRDLTAARRYLGVYLMGARDAAAKFSEIYAKTRSPDAQRDFEALLVDLTSNFAARTEAFLQNDRTDLTVEIEVLRERLARENLPPNRPT